jgi:hypothetical protein
MPDKRGRLARILEQEYKSQGLVSGTASAVGKRLREIIDVRNLFFSGTGMGSVIGQKVFGKGYSATTSGKKLPEDKLTPVTSPSSAMSETLLMGIKQDTKITAKNSIVLPQLARDMNLVRQNIAKLVKLQGGTASQRADMFFKRAGEREAEYERRFGKMQAVSTTPTQINKPEGFGLQGAIAAILAAVGIMVAANWEKVKPYYEEFKIVLYKVLGALAALSLVKGALSMPRPVPVPAPGTPGKPGTPTPGAPGTPGAPAPGGPDKTGPKKPSQRRPGTKPGGLAIPKETKSEKLIEKLKKLLQSPKAKAKFMMLMAKRGFGWIATALFFSGPVGWVITAILTAMAFNDIMGIIDEAFKDDEATPDNTSKTPTNMNQQQSDMASLIYNRFREAGFSDVQAKAAVANAMAESSLNPEAHNTKGEDSVGLFQMNRKGGLGQGHSIENLKDPEYNIALAIDAAKKSKSFREATSINDAVSAFVKDVERPKDQAGAIAKRTQIAMDMDNKLGGALNGSSVALNDAAKGAQGNSSYIDNRTTNNVVQKPSTPTQATSTSSVYDKELIEGLIYKIL